MKRHHVSIWILIAFLSFILLSMRSCAKQTLISESVDDLSTLSLKRTNTIGLKDVGLYLRAYKGMLETKSNEVDIAPVVIDGDTLFYLINYEKGWELLSADRRAPRRLIWAEDGNAGVEDFYDNPATETVFRTIVDGMNALLANQEWKPSLSYANGWDDLYLRDGCGPWELISVTVEERDTIQDHLTLTRWGQSSPWNVCAPYMSSSLSAHCFTGCVPVAAAQTLYYLRDKFGMTIDTYENCHTDSYIVDTTGLILHESDVDFASYNHSDNLWASMPLTASESSGCFSAVSALMVRMGVDLGVEYKLDGTYGYTSKIKNMYSNRYGISSSYTTNVNFDTVVDEIIREQQPVILGIAGFKNNGARYGHAVVADAGREVTEITTKVYRKWIPLIDPDPLFSKGPGLELGSYAYRTEVSEELLERYVGINWGWDGSFMYSGSSPIWFNTEIMSWTVGNRKYTVAERMLYNFGIIE